MSSQLIGKTGIWKELIWFQSWVISPILPNRFLYYRETVSFKYIFPSLYGSASNILASLTWSHRPITVSIYIFYTGGITAPGPFFSLIVTHILQSFKQYCKSWGSNPVSCLSSVSWSSKNFSPLDARKLQSLCPGLKTSGTHYKLLAFECLTATLQNICEISHGLSC